MKENPLCPSGTGLEVLGPEVPDTTFVLAVVMDGSDIVVSTVDRAKPGPDAGSIWTVGKTDGAVTEIVSGVRYPDRLVVHEQFVYWLEASFALRRAPRKGGDAEVIMGPGNSMYIASNGEDAYALVGDSLFQLASEGDLAQVAPRVPSGPIAVDRTGIFCAASGGSPSTQIVRVDAVDGSLREVAWVHNSAPSSGVARRQSQ